MGEEHLRKRISLCKGLEETIGNMGGTEDSLMETQSGRQGPVESRLFSPGRAGGRAGTPGLDVRTLVRRTPPFSLSIFMINPHSKGFYPHFADGKTEAQKGQLI